MNQLCRVIGALPTLSMRQNEFVDAARHEKVLTWLTLTVATHGLARELLSHNGIIQTLRVHD